MTTQEGDQNTLLGQLRWIILRYRFIILSIVVVAVGLIMIYYANNMSAPTWILSVAQDMGTALITTGTIGLALEYYARKQFQELVTDSMTASLVKSTLGERVNALRDLVISGTDLQKLGIKQVHLTRKDIDLQGHLDQASPGSDIKILGVCMASFTGSSMQHVIEQKLIQNCKVKWLILDADSQGARDRAIAEDRSYEDIKVDIAGRDTLHTNYITNRLTDELRKRIELRRYSLTPAYFVFSTDKILIVGFYLQGKRGEFYPHLELEIKKDGFYEPFLDHFDRLWEISAPAKDTGKKEG
ncbi:MAG: hypothetical protein PVF83_03600 [Anaerolineales bacterium]|jgi:hypothetical protein